jgi:hypothetical protein
VLVAQVADQDSNSETYILVEAVALEDILVEVDMVNRDIFQLPFPLQIKIPQLVLAVAVAVGQAVEMILTEMVTLAAQAAVAAVLEF